MSTLPRILLVEDDPTTSFLHQRLLRRLEVAQQLVAVTNGAQALAYLASLTGEADDRYPTLILLDLRMPVLDGWSFLEGYHQLPYPRRQAPVIVLAIAALSVAEVERLQALSVAGVFYKPLTAEKVDQLLRLLAGPSSASIREATIP